MNNLYSLDNMKVAKKLCPQLFKIEKMLENQLKQLYTYKEYRDVKYVIESTTESLYMVRMHYRNYKNILDNKGRLNE